MTSPIVSINDCHLFIIFPKLAIIRIVILESSLRAKDGEEKGKEN